MWIIPSLLHFSWVGNFYYYKLFFSSEEFNELLTEGGKVSI